MKQLIKLYIDYETKSKCDIKTHGDYIYANHPTTEIILLTYRLSTWEPGVVKYWTPGQKTPSEFKKGSYRIIAQQYKFEYHITKRFFIDETKAHKNYLKFENWDCTMARSMRCGLPGSLGDLSYTLKLKTGKLAAGKGLIAKYSSPVKKTGEFREITEADWKLWLVYGRDDVLAMESIDRIVPELEPEEREIFLADAYTNAYGFRVDLKSTLKLKEIYARELEKAKSDAIELAGVTPSGTITLSSTQEYRKWLAFHGYKVSNIQANTLKNLNIKLREDRKTLKLIDSGTITLSTQEYRKWLVSRGLEVLDIQTGALKDLNVKLKESKETREKPKTAKDKKHSFQIKANLEKVEKVLKSIELRTLIAAKAAAKLEPFTNYLDHLNIARNQLQYAGAHTLRWAGRGIQPQNLVSDCIKESEFKKALEDLEKNPEVFNADSNGNNPIKQIGKMLRLLIIPRKNNIFAVGDLSAIEARAAFWLAGCTRVLDLYRKGEDIYVDFAAMFFQKEKSEVTKADRSFAKVCILAFQYGMGALAFVATCDKFGIVISEREAKRTQEFYKSMYPEIPIFWKGVEKTYKKALQNKGERFEYANITVWYSGKSLKVKMPSGRLMYYFDCKIVEEENKYNGRMQEVLTYRRGRFWGGTILENLASGLSRDLLGAAFVKAYKAGLNPILTIHDEIPCDVPKKGKKKSLQMLHDILVHVPEWAASWMGGLPLDAECALIGRYGKI